MLASHGDRGGVVSPEEAQAMQLTAAELDYIEYEKKQSIFGTPEECHAKLVELGKTYDVDEFVVVTITHDFAARVRSYELLAEAFGLESAPAEEA